MNLSDSERIATLLEEGGLHEASEIEEADLVIFTTCGVRKTAEDRAFGQIHNIWKRKKGTKIVVTGCLAHRKDVQRRLGDKVHHFIPAKDIPLLGSILGLTKEPELKEIECSDYLKITPKYKSTETVFIPIMTGCNNFCTYCVVPYARGREWSRPFEEIFKEITFLEKNDCKEIILLGQNVNSYSFSPKERVRGLKLIDFPSLLKLLANSFPKITFRFLTSHPKDFSEELIRVIAKNKNISKEIHLPIQSGSDKILAAMNRKYTQKHYINIIEKINKNIPTAKISTDIIIGFPGETLQDFEKTVQVFKKVHFHTAFLNKYSPRPGTIAEKFNDSIPWEEKKRRELVLRKLF